MMQIFGHAGELKNVLVGPAAADAAPVEAR
jgi:hypothetical protein